MAASPPVFCKNLRRSTFMHVLPLVVPRMQCSAERCTADPGSMRAAPGPRGLHRTTACCGAPGERTHKSCVLRFIASSHTLARSRSQMRSTSSAAVNHAPAELPRPPAGVTEREQALLRPLLARDVAQDFARRRDRHATIDHDGAG